MRAVRLTAFGNPVDGLEYVDIPEPDAPGPNQVLIGVEFSPINPNDLMVAQGIYAFRPPLPTVIGNEGVGRILAVGPGVESVKVGDRGPGARLQQVDDEYCERMQNWKHRSQRCDDSTLSCESGRIEFSEETVRTSKRSGCSSGASPASAWWWLRLDYQRAVEAWPRLGRTTQCGNAMGRVECD